MHANNKMNMKNNTAILLKNEQFTHKMH